MMTIEQQALALELRTLAAQAEKTDDDIRYYSGGSKHNEGREKLNNLLTANLPDIISALEERGQLEAFRQEVSEAVDKYFTFLATNGTSVELAESEARFSRFIIAPPVDPIQECLRETFGSAAGSDEFRAALAKHGLAITKEAVS